MDWTQWILTAAAFVVAVGGAVGYLAKLVKPFKELAQRVERVERHDREDMERFEKLEKRIEENMRQSSAADQAVYKAVLSMLNHMIDGNHIDGMKRARSELYDQILKQ